MTKAEKGRQLVTVELTVNELTRVQLCLLERIEQLEDLLPQTPKGKRRKLEIDLVSTIADLKVLCTKGILYG